MSDKTTIEVTRDENGNWWTKNGKTVYIGEDAKVLDLLLLPKENGESK